MRNTLIGIYMIMMVFTACAPEPTLVPTNIVPPPSETTALTPAIAPLVTSTSIPFPTPSVDTPRWVLYERALSYIFLGPPGKTLPDLSRDHGLCEWEIWGQNGNEVYVWALCQMDNAVGTATSTPAVIHLGKDGTILEIEMPDEGFGNLKELFPEDVLVKIAKNEFPGNAAWDRIQRRRKDSSILPLIVEQGVKLP
jgi:hypothetical protein